ncbi:hypothetical protein [Nitrosomonas sp. JL21]|uniref:hypothetical protein n=1 Tax=Nitrosomonas sp. JL21 TaxID=153949 RepID=UPI001368E6C0|nr:hypothetical protein [Nitrosomonas sp. JL21]MBL8496781.1 hypothetical protein [Nitrosomonas sp.]MBL8498467.1 hypothetical protein [Nitrosomonas sp.]
MSNNTTEQNESKQEAIPVPVLDCEAFREDLVDCDLTIKEENEYLAILWDIMRMMVDLNLDMDAVHMLMPPSLCKAFNDEDVVVEQPSNQTEPATEKSNGERSNHG